MIYFIRAGALGGPVKIGYAGSISARLRDLQIANHMPLELIRNLDGGKWLESLLHCHFSGRRIRGEWFLYTPEMLTITAEDLEAYGPRRDFDPNTPAARVIELFGGMMKLSAVLGLHHILLHRWRLPTERIGGNGVIPAEYHKRLLFLAQELGLPLSPADLGMASATEVA